MDKIKVFNCASVVIIYNRDYPSNIFLQQKDPGLPNIFGQDQALCPFGGNWLGDEAVDDRGPYETLCRELKEELWPKREVCVSSEVYDMWRVSVESILSNLLPYRVALVETATSVLDLMPGNQKTGFVTRVSYFICPLENDVWQNLETLQSSLDNLSSEGNSCIVTLEEIRASNLRVAYSHDHMLKLFFLEKGLDVEGMNMYSNPPIKEVDWLDTYTEILNTFDIEKKPI